MSIQKQLQKAMIDNDIKYAKQLSELSKVTYKRTLAVLNNEPSAYLKDAEIIGKALGVNLAYIKLGEE
jgi:hypothetical protein